MPGGKREEQPVDISKLPKLSQTPETKDEQPPAEAATPESPREELPPPGVRRAVPAEPRGGGYDAYDSSGGEIWFNVIVGVIFLLLGGTYFSYTVATLTHQPYHTKTTWQTGPKAGQEVTYPELQGNPMLSDSAMFFFGLAVLADAVLRFVLARRSGVKAVVIVAFALTAGATAYNLYVVALLQKAGVLPLLSLLAVAFGGYMAFQQWGTLKAIQAAEAHQRSR